MRPSCMPGSTYPTPQAPSAITKFGVIRIGVAHRANITSARPTRMPKKMGRASELR